MAGGRAEFNTWRRGETGPRGPAGETGPRGEIGPQGPQGIPGTAGEQFQIEAGEQLPAYSIVYAEAGKAYVVDTSNVAHVNRAIGITTEVVAMGDDAVLCTVGRLDNNAWTWQPGSLWIGPDGHVASVPGTGSFIQLVGKTVSPTSIFVFFGDAILL